MNKIDKAYQNYKKKYTNNLLIVFLSFSVIVLSILSLFKVINVLVPLLLYLVIIVFLKKRDVKKNVKDK